MSLLFVSGIRSTIFIKKRERASKRTKVFCIIWKRCEGSVYLPDVDINLD